MPSQDRDRRAEHGPGSPAVLLTNSAKLAAETPAAIDKLLSWLPTAAIAPLRAKAEGLKSGEFSPLWSGQNASGCREVPAAQLARFGRLHQAGVAI